MSTIDPGPRLGQATQPQSLLPDAALLAQTELRDAPPPPGRPADRGARVRLFALHATLALVALLISLPFVWMVLTGLKSLSEVDAANWLPSTVHWDNFVKVFDSANPDPFERGVPLLRYGVNSLFVAAWVHVPPGRHQRAGRLQLRAAEVAGKGQGVPAVPEHDDAAGAGDDDPQLPGDDRAGAGRHAAGPDRAGGLQRVRCTFLLRQFMLSIPASLDEAAEIDGAGKLRLFFDVILPLSRPGLVTLTIFTFMGNYNSFFWPLVMIRSQARYTLPIGLLAFDSSRGQVTHLLMAAVTLSVLPLIALFVAFQKYLVKGIQLGAVKG